MRVSCLVLAAGDSTRMNGKNKLMLNVNGESLIKKTLQEVQKISFEEVLVVTGFENSRIENEVQEFSFRTVYNENHQTGLHSSIRAGLQALRRPCDAFLICLSDQPYFHHQNVQAVLKAFETAKSHGIFVPSFDGKRGHPVLISSKFKSEILDHPDGDYGCSYLFKRHPAEVHLVPVSNEGILLDIDQPEDYQKYLQKADSLRDPVQDFYAKTLDLRASGQPFAIATVVEVIGSASAKTGSKALFDSNGQNISGYVGGGCAERFIGDESKAAILEGQTRIVLADLDDEIFGLGVACGGKMKVFIDPILPAEEIPLPINNQFHIQLNTLCSHYGWKPISSTEQTQVNTFEELLLLMNHAAAKKRSRTAESLRFTKQVPARFLDAKVIPTNEVTIVGRTRITEALARHFTWLNYSVRVVGPSVKKEDYPSSVQCQCLEFGYRDIDFRNGEIVIIASHSSQDPILVQKALDAKASHVAMVGSLKRAHEVLNHLGSLNQDVSHPLYIPAGLDIDAKNPDEIALSVVGEVLTVQGASR